MEQMLITSKHFLKELVVCLAMLQVAVFLLYMLIPKPILKSFKITFKANRWILAKLSKYIKLIFIQAKNACVCLVNNYRDKKQPSYANKKVVDLSKYRKAK